MDKDTLTFTTRLFNGQHINILLLRAPHLSDWIGAYNWLVGGTTVVISEFWSKSR